MTKIEFATGLYLCNINKQTTQNIMNTTLTIKNFRVFDENGVDVKLSPLTILTGCNSSGKSSIVKSVLLLDSFLKQIRKDHENGDPIRLSAYKLDFSTYPNNLLGRYDKIVNSRSEDKRITFAYTVHSLMLSKDVEVKLVFCADQNDELNNGYLESLTLSCEEGVIYFSGKNPKGCTCNLNLIKEEAVEYILTEMHIKKSSSVYVDNNISDKDFQKQKESLNEFVNMIGVDRLQDILRYLRNTNKKEYIINELKCDPQILEWTKDHASFFYIPLVEALKDATKENIKSKLTDEILVDKALNTSLRGALDRVITDFVDSNCTTFGEYFKQKECCFLEEAVTSSAYDLDEYILFKSFPYVPSKTEFKIRNHYFFSESDNVIDPAELPELLLLKFKGLISSLPKPWYNKPVNFVFLYDMLMNINNVYTSHENSLYYKQYMSDEALIDPSLGGIYYHHYTFEVLNLFAHYLVMECLLPAWSGKIAYVSSSRVDVKRLYPLDGTDDFTQLLQRYFEGKRLQKSEDHDEAVYGPQKRKDYRLNRFTSQCLKAFGIGESIIFKVDEDGLGVKLFLHRADGSEDSLLADEGYGITQLVSILLQIETAIVTAKGEPVNSISGFIDPDKRDSSKFYYEPRIIAIEEPEIHLHPKFQSLLADMFTIAYKKYNIRFIIETHSEYLIRKMQVLVAKKRVEPGEVSLLYVNSSDADKRPEGEPHVKEIGICEDGYLSDSFGTGFFDEATSLSHQLL